jgi:hypothetical protein
VVNSQDSPQDKDTCALLQEYPVLVIGCKKDLVEGSKSAHLALNQRVLNELKKVDPGNSIDYFESGVSLATGAYRVP